MVSNKLGSKNSLDNFVFQNTPTGFFNGHVSQRHIHGLTRRHHDFGDTINGFLTQFQLARFEY